MCCVVGSGSPSLTCSGSHVTQHTRTADSEVLNVDTVPCGGDSSSFSELQSAFSVLPAVVPSHDHIPANSDGGGCDFVIQITPRFTKYWIPICKESLKPAVGMIFATLDEGLDFYARYAYEVGFDVRHGTSDTVDGVIRSKHMMCHRQGFKSGKRNTGKRMRLSNRVGCGAKAVFKLVGSRGCLLRSFEERHTHPFVDSLGKLFMKKNRKLDLRQQTFVLDCTRARIGPAKSYTLFKEIVGGYPSVGPLAIDYQNFRRDLLAYMNGSDAQIVLNRFFEKQECCSAFYFAYDVDESDRLTRLFWCDPISRKNYSIFGDVVAFDSTYNTNRYLRFFKKEKFPFPFYTVVMSCHVIIL